MTLCLPDAIRSMVEEDVRRVWSSYLTSVRGTLAECPFCGMAQTAQYLVERAAGKDDSYTLRLECSRCYGRLEAAATCENACVDVRWRTWNESPPAIRRGLEAVAAGPDPAWPVECLDGDGDVIRVVDGVYAPDEPRAPYVIISRPHGSSIDVVLRLLAKLSRKLEAERASADLEDSDHAAA